MSVRPVCQVQQTIKRGPHLDNGIFFSQRFLFCLGRETKDRASSAFGLRFKRIV